MFIFIVIEGLIHMLEELFFGFPSWATKNFGTTTLEWYLISHAIIIPPMLFVLLKAQKNKRESKWVLPAISIQTLAFTNGLFHLITAILFQEYSPGVISSILVTFPFSCWFYRKIFSFNFLPKKRIVKFILAGCVTSILIIVSLYLNMNITLR